MYVAAHSPLKHIVVCCVVRVCARACVRVCVCADVQVGGCWQQSVGAACTT